MRLRAAVVHGLANAKAIMEQIQAGTCRYAFIEVMACEGGCITGPSTHNDIVSGRRQLAQELLKRKESYETMDR